MKKEKPTQSAEVINQSAEWEPAIENRYRSARQALKDLENGITKKQRKSTPNWVLSIIDPRSAKYVKPRSSKMHVEKTAQELKIYPGRGRGDECLISTPYDWIFLAFCWGALWLMSWIHDTLPELIFPMILIICLIGFLVLVFQFQKPVCLRFLDPNKFEIFQYSTQTSEPQKILNWDTINSIRYVGPRLVKQYSLNSILLLKKKGLTVGN